MKHLPLLVLLLAGCTTDTQAANCARTDMYVGQPLAELKNCFANNPRAVVNAGSSNWRGHNVDIYRYRITDRRRFHIYVENGKVVGWDEYR